LRCSWRSYLSFCRRVQFCERPGCSQRDVAESRIKRQRTTVHVALLTLVSASIAERRATGGCTPVGSDHGPGAQTRPGHAGYRQAIGIGYGESVARRRSGRSPSTTYTASAPTATPATTARSHCSNASARAARLTTTSQPGRKVTGPTSTSTPSSPRNGQTRATEQTHNRRPKPEVETASWHLTSKLTNQPTSGAPVSPFLAWMCSHEERPDFLPESFYVVVVPWFGRPAK
jgi:hypothetical protein